jgi:hypothetical protein
LEESVAASTERAGLGGVAFKPGVDRLGREALEGFVVKEGERAEIGDLDRPGTLVERFSLVISDVVEEGVDGVIGRVVPAVGIAGASAEGMEEGHVGHLVEEDVAQLLEPWQVAGPERVDPDALDTVSGCERRDPGVELHLHGHLQRGPERVEDHELGAERTDALRLGGAEGVEI